MKNYSIPNVNGNIFSKVFSSFLMIAVLLAFSPSATGQATAKKKNNKIKLFMLWDMEGTSGVFDKEQTWYWDKGVSKETMQNGLDLITADVNAAAKAALEAGVDELIICDTHHGGNNIIAEKLISDPRIKFLPRSSGVLDGKTRWMPYLDEETDGFLVMAHHAKPNTEGAFLPHAQSLDWADISVNGLSIGEMGIESCYAGYWNIPVIMMSGDRAACKEAEEQFPGIITAEVKHAITWDKAEGPSPDEAHKIIAKKVKEAVKKLKSGGSFTTYKPTLPMTVKIKFTSFQAAEKAAARPGVERLDPYTVQAKVDQQCDIMKWITGSGLDMPTRK
jgi:D-amino peptidase